MDMQDRSGSPDVRIPRPHALTISHALVEQARRDARCLVSELMAELGSIETYPLRSRDAQSAAGDLVRTLSALEAVGWPHSHEAGGTAEPADER